MRMFRAVVNGSEYKVEIEEIREGGSPNPQPSSKPTPPTSTPVQNPTSNTGPNTALNAANPALPKQPERSGEEGGAVTAPMPGTVLKVAVTKGDNVTKGQTLVVLEAMKMENEIQAPADGMVEVLDVTEGASVNAGDILVVLSS